MKKLLLGLLSAAALLPAPVLSQNWVPYTLSALGCMKVGDCTEGVYKVSRASDLELFGATNWKPDERKEAEDLIEVLAALNVDIYIAEPKYFQRSMLAVYYTDDNTIYLNGERDSVPTTILESLRHEGWHTAQDCMAGSIDNTFMAVIYQKKDIPEKYTHIAKMRYGRFKDMAMAVPWEIGAIYAGETPGLTVSVLNACKNGPLWETIEPTPMTREWLVKEGYIK